MKSDLLLIVGCCIACLVMAVIGVSARDWLMADGWPRLSAVAVATTLAVLGAVGVVVSLGALARWASRNCDAGEA